MGVNSCVNSLISNLKASRAVLSPGSRNAPILKSIFHSNLSVHSIVDERSAGFIALGMAKRLNAPVILNCTSGTALLNYYPVIAEAFYARVPLIIVSADRPPEQIDAWDGQAIRQKNVFSNHIRAFFETPSNYENEKDFSEIAHKVNAYWETEIPGPIHINVPIREPFYSSMKSEGFVAPVSVKKAKIEVSLQRLQAHLNQNFLGKQILIFNGMESGEQVSIHVDCLAWQTVELSDVTSNIPSEISHWDALLYSSLSSKFKDLEDLKPDVLISTGTTTVSKGLKQFLRMFKPEAHYHVSKYDEVGALFETHPTWVDANHIQVDPSDEQLVGMAQWSNFKSSWVSKTEKLKQQMQHLNWEMMHEFSSVKVFLEQLPNNAILHVANSMAIRYVSYFKEIIDDKKIVVRSNRGTSGIDGCTSTAVGEALCLKEDVYLLTGDIAFLYDINGLWNAELPNNLKIIILNNQGGGIFDLIKGPEQMGEAIQLQLTHHKRSIKKITKAFNLSYSKAKSLEEVAQKVRQISSTQKASVLEIKTNRKINHEFYSQFSNLA